MKNAVKQSYRFARTNRLSSKDDFSAVFNERLKFSQGGFLALYKRNPQIYPRLGIVVSKHLVKTATARNYLKRVVREGFRVHKSQLKPLDIVILARRGCSVLDKVKLKKELATLWERLIEA